MPPFYNGGDRLKFISAIFDKLTGSKTGKLAMKTAAFIHAGDLRGSVKFAYEERGQLTLGGVIALTLLVVVFTALFPTIVNQAGNASAATSDTATQSILGLIPLFTAIGVLVSVLVYSRIERL